MFRQLIPTTALIAILCWVVSAQPSKSDGPLPQEAKPDKEPTPAPKTDAKTGPNIFELQMQDDTVMKVTLVDPSISLITKYGKLVVPASELRRLEFGFRYPEGMEAKIEKAIGDLGSADFRTREDAEQRLAEIGFYAIPALRRATKNTDPEVARRATAILKLQDVKPGRDKDDEFHDYDIVETAEFTAKGKLESTTLKVRTKYFGDTTVNIADIKSFRSLSRGSPWRLPQ
jgi:hypothetical protein